MTEPSSDDYFHDSFTLDDDDLALLDEAEAKFSLDESKTSTRFSISPPPAKRYRGWIPPTIAETLPEPEPEPTPSPTPDAKNTIPDILLGGIGSYCVKALEGEENGPGALVDGNTSSIRVTSKCIQQNPARSRSEVSLGSPAMLAIHNNNTPPRNGNIVNAPTKVRKVVHPVHVVSAATPAVSPQTSQTSQHTVHRAATTPEQTEIKKELASLKAELERVH